MGVRTDEFIKWAKRHKKALVIAGGLLVGTMAYQGMKSGKEAVKPLTEIIFHPYTIQDLEKRDQELLRACLVDLHDVCERAGCTPEQTQSHIRFVTSGLSNVYGKNKTIKNDPNLKDERDKARKLALAQSDSFHDLLRRE